MAKHEIDEALIRKVFKVLEAVKQLPGTTTLQGALKEVNEDASLRLRNVFMDKGHGMTLRGVLMEARARGEFEEKVRKAQAKKRLTLLKARVDNMIASADRYNARGLEVALEKIEQIAGKKRKAREMMSECREWIFNHDTYTKQSEGPRAVLSKLSETQMT